VLGVAWWTWAQGREETDDAYIDGHISIISPRVSGTVEKVLVEDNQIVKSGDLLVTLDTSDFKVEVDRLKASLDQAKYQSSAAQSKIGQSTLSAQGQSTQASGSMNATQADIESARAALMQAQEQVKQAKAKVTEEQAHLNYTRSDFKRYELAYQNKAVTQQHYDQAKQNIDMAEAQVAEAQHGVEQALKQEMQARSAIAQAQGRKQSSQGSVTSAEAAAKQEQIDREQYKSTLSAVETAKSELEKAVLNLSYCQIKAPISGRVGKRTVEVGQHVEPGEALCSVVRDDYWITANFKETQLGRMHRGQEVDIEIDSFPGHKFKGRIDSFSPASGAKFSILPPDNATGNFTKVVQRIPVKILFDEASLGDYKARLSPGMSCIVTVMLSK
jgi:membrane fusion protein (multidrug efflux system)